MSLINVGVDAFRSALSVMLFPGWRLYDVVGVLMVSVLGCMCVSVPVCEVCVGL